MSSIININNQELEIKEYKGQRVVTFKDIDRVHERTEGTASRNFRENRDRFIKDVDYFEINREDVGMNFVETYGFGNKAPSGILLTESGYLMVVKSLKDDLAWEIQRKLVNGYFRIKESMRNMELEKAVYALSTQLEMMMNKINQMEISIDEKVSEKLEQLSEYYKPTHSAKIHLCNYIKKKLGVEGYSKEYELVKQRVLLILNADKWQDVSFETLMKSLYIVDECIEIIKATRVNKQVSLFD